MPRSGPPADCLSPKQKQKREYRLKNRAKILEQQRVWYQAHREEEKKKHKLWYQDNREWAKAKAREYYAKHRARAQAARRSWSANHREQVRVRSEEYRKANREKIKAEKREYAARNRDRIYERQRRWREKTGRTVWADYLAYQYSLTPEDYENMLLQQNWQCVCGQDLRILPKKNVHLDHNHATGTVRSILCYRCNLAIGFAGEDPRRLRLLADYLEATADLTNSEPKVTLTTPNSYTTSLCLCQSEPHIALARKEPRS